MTKGLEDKMSVEQAMKRTNTKSPKQALDEMKKKNNRYGYLPHTGAKQRAKAERRRIEALKKSVGL